METLLKSSTPEVSHPIFETSHALILADEIDSGLWPIARKQLPKQFIKIPELEGKSLFEKALERTQKAIYPKNIRVIAHESYRDHCISQAKEVGVLLQDTQILTESSHKGRLVSILVALEGIPDDDVVVVFSSDHILEINSFCERAKSLMPLGEDKIILYTMSARSPLLSRGYIKLQNPENRVSPIAAMRENASESEVKNYIKEGFVWDSGIFAFKKGVFLRELEKIDSTLNLRVQESKNDPVLFEKLPNISLYSGFFEKSQNVVGVQIEDITVIDAADDSLIESQKTYYMPWGMVNIIHEGPTYRVRKLTLNPEQKIPLQTHLHRIEAWSVGYGVAKVTVGTETRYLQKGESIHISIGVPHRLENPGKTPLIILENQVGDYLGDDDTIFFEDGYGKVVVE